MSIFEKLVNLAENLIVAGQKAQIEMRKKAESRIREYEREIKKAERSSKMNDLEYARKIQQQKQRLEQMKMKIYTGGQLNDNIQLNEKGQLVIKNKSIDQWDCQWQFIGRMNKIELEQLKPYNTSIGLYKAVMNGKIMYIGRAIEYANGGFRKRLRDYTRESNSGRKHQSGKKMYEYSPYLDIYFLVVGNSMEDVRIVKVLERALIQKHQPRWNVQYK